MRKIFLLFALWATVAIQQWSVRVVFAESTSFFNPRIINGAQVSSSSIPVVKITIRDSNSSYLCSGTMISHNVVLTARHCVSRRASNHTVHLNGRNYSVSKVRIHPLSRENDQGDLVYDAALLYLRRNPRSTYFPIISKRKVESGDPIYIYGYGLDEAGQTEQLKTGTMTVASTSRYWINANFTGQGDSNTCEGDSGGPAFGSYQDKDGITSLGLVAITAGGVLQDCSVGDSSYFTNLQSAETISFLRRNVSGLRLQ